MTFWKNGFTIDGGELKGFDDQKNVMLLQQIKSGFVPREIAGDATEVFVRLENKRDEEFSKPKPKFVPFGGKGGRSLGTKKEEKNELSTTASSISKEEKTEKVEIKIDSSKPVTTLQIRLYDGKRCKSQFNLDHTVGLLKKFVSSESGLSVNDFELMTTYPRKTLGDSSKTLEDEGLKNMVVIQNKK